ncbi:hypothetical protein BGZ50_000535 [Haplosporangium sp. Z 11]|nr:hypothetical protein BGZ50_000535 [Haplosporangium sp. Z 11]
MTFFKLTGVNASSSKKNKTASAANTPSQTPRTSVQLNASDVAALHSKSGPMTTENAVDMLFEKATMGHMQALTMARM